MNGLVTMGSDHVGGIRWGGGSCVFSVASIPYEIILSCTHNGLGVLP
jgi:hypothetical protein